VPFTLFISLLDDRKLNYFGAKVNSRGFATTTAKESRSWLGYAPALFGLAPRLLMKAAECYGYNSGSMLLKHS
jgi:hypothetical protein